MKIFEYDRGKGCFWFRVFGMGLVFTHVSKGMLFSERNGYVKHITLFNYRIKLTRRIK